MDIFLFLITIFYLPLITTTKQPFIDCNGKSFLCENSTHFTICVDVGGGLSMTVGNIVLPCPPTTFCDEMNAFECEYQASTTQNSLLLDTDTPREVTEAPVTTNIYDEFLYTTSLQYTKEAIVIPTQGNTNVNFKDDTDNFVLLYDNIDDATLYNTPENEIIQKNNANNDQINEFKSKNIDVNKKFTRRNKETYLEFKDAHYELSTIVEQITDTTDKMVTTFTESIDNVATEESPTVEFVTAIENFHDSVTPLISVEYFGNNLSTEQNYQTTLKNNQLGDIEDRIVFKDLLFASTTDETVTSDLSTTPETYIQNDKSSKTIISSETSDFDISFGDLLKVNKDFIEVKTPTIDFTDGIVGDSTIFASTIAPENLKESLKDLKSISNNNSLNYDLQTESSNYLTQIDFDISNNTEGNTFMTSVANRTITDDNFQSRSQNRSITNKTASMTNNNQVMLTTIEENTTNKLFNREATQDFMTNNEKSLNNDTNLNNKLAPNLILSNVVSNASMVNNTSDTDDISKSKAMMFGVEPENSTLYTNLEKTFPTENLGILEQNISYQTTLETNQLGGIEDTIVFQDLLFASTAGDTVTSKLSTTPETYTQNDKFSEAYIPSESSDVDISFGDLLKPNKDFTELNIPTQVHFTNMDSTILDYTIKPENKESINELRSTSHNNYLNYDLQRISSEYVTPFYFDISNSTEGKTPITFFANKTSTGDNFLNNETLIAVNKTLSKDLLLEDTNITPNPIFFFQNTNIVLNTAITTKEIINKIHDTDESTSPRYNLGNNLLNITTVTFSEEGYTKPIKTIDKATYFANLDEQRIMDEVSISNVLLTNVTRDNYKNSNDKNIEDVEIIQNVTGMSDETGEDNKIIMGKNNELLNYTFYVLDHPTRSTLEVSDFYLTTRDLNYNKTENVTIHFIENNITSSVKSETLEDYLSTTLKLNNNREIVNNESTMAIVENVTEPVFNISNYMDYPGDKKNDNGDIDQIDLKRSKATNYKEKRIMILDKNNMTGQQQEQREKIAFDILGHHNNYTMEALPNTTNARMEVTTNVYTEVINNQGIPNDTYVDVTKNFAQSVATISNSISDKEQETKFFDYSTVLEDITKVPMAKSSITDTIPEKQLKENRKENINDIALNNTENFTQRTLETQISNDTFVDLIKNVESAVPIFNSINNKEQKIDYIEASIDNTEVPILKSSLINENTQEKQFFVDENRKENINEFDLNNTENLTQSTVNKPISDDNESTGNNFVSGKVTNNPNILYNTKHNIQDNYRSTMNIPYAIMATENAYLTTERINNEITSNMLFYINRNINKEPIEKSKPKTYEKHISINENKERNPRIGNDTSINSLNNSAQTRSTISSSINSNGQETYRIENIEKTVAEQDIRGSNASLKFDTEHVNGKSTTHSPDKFLSSFNLLKVTNSTFNIFNETNHSTTKATVETSKDVHTKETVMTNSTDYINGVAIDKFAQENISSKSDYNLSYDKPVIRIGLQFNLQDITTKSIDTIVNLNERINVGDITEQSLQNNIKNATLLKENKNEPLIQNCSDRSNCLFQTDPPISIELHNKSINGVSLKSNTNSTTEEIILRKNDQTTLNTNISNVWSETELGADDKIAMKTERYINDGIFSLNPTDFQRKSIGIKDVDNTDVISNTKIFKDRLQLQTSHLGQSNVSDHVKSSTNPLKEVQLIYNLTNKNHERDKSHIKDNSRPINVTIPPLISVDKNKSKQNENDNKGEIPKKIVQNSNLKTLKTTTKTNILETSKSVLTFDCSNHSRGRYADKDNCRKFYICIGYITPVVGLCPVNTVFSELRKQCTNNLSHCIRNNQFKCVKEGRFIDVWQENMYYLCVNNSDNRFSRFKFQCKNGYVLDKLNLKCKQSKKILKLSSSSSSNSSSSSSNDKKKRNSNAKKSNKKISNDTSFKCNQVGKFVDPNDCRKYYVCTKTSKSGLRRKRKKCDSDEVFDDDKKECVDEDSYECK